MYAIKLHNRTEIDSIIRFRADEQKLGQTLDLGANYPDCQTALKKTKAKFVLLGVPEDIGPRANFGSGGAESAYPAFLQAFLNIQDNQFINGSSVLLLGELHIKALQEKLKHSEDISELRSAVEQIDDMLWPIISLIVRNGKIPIVIGGGHNNAFPLLKGSHHALKKPIGVINIDPHADLRPLEGRHSGNGFSYAIANDYLDKYQLIGLQEMYNNKYMLAKIQADKRLFAVIPYNDFILNKISVKKAVKQAVSFVNSKPFGLELDLDCIALAEVSAKTPSGFSVAQVRKMVKLLSKEKNIVYFNLSEGIANGNYPTGKLIAYFVADFISE